jgi:hypothetical protein
MHGLEIVAEVYVTVSVFVITLLLVGLHRVQHTKLWVELFAL